MKILAFDTANNGASVAVADSNNILAYIEELRPSMQAETIMPMIEKALRESNLSYNDIDYLAVTNGPGSFTGIRIGLSVAKGILFGANTKAVAVSNFEYAYFRSLMQIKDYDKIYVFLNAYRGQLYLQVFNRNASAQPPLLIDYGLATQLLSNDTGNIICTGSGLEVIYHQIKQLPNITLLPRFARVKAFIICRYIISKIAAGGKLNDVIEPLYIRPPDAKAPIAWRHGQ